MMKNLYKNQTDGAYLVNESTTAYYRTGIPVIEKSQIISDLHVGIRTLKAEQRGEYVKFGSLDDLIAELEN